ncbi:MAG: YkgJ family cysteine cluster protein [Nitrospira sp.]|nr:YkgJ family cysteine cluster protein [Nitrospira sp.]
MSATRPTEQYEISIQTAAGHVTTMVDVPTAFVPVTAIIPLLRRLGEEAQRLETTRSAEEGRCCSCTKGCAACCRMLVPLSPPEAFRLMEVIRLLPIEQQDRIVARLEQSKSLLRSHGIWQRLLDVGASERPLNDDELAPLNEAYYSLRMPCPFLEDETCSIYNERPSACRELLVTSPPDYCQDMANNPVDALPAPIRVSTVLGLLWGELTGTPPRMIPLPILRDWVEHHRPDRERTWQGVFLLEAALDKIWRFLSQDRNGAPTESPQDRPIRASGVQQEFVDKNGRT